MGIRHQDMKNLGRLQKSLYWVNIKDLLKCNNWPKFCTLFGKKFTHCLLNRNNTIKIWPKTEKKQNITLTSCLIPNFFLLYKESDINDLFCNFLLYLLVKKECLNVFVTPVVAPFQIFFLRYFVVFYNIYCVLLKKM